MPDMPGMGKNNKVGCRDGEGWGDDEVTGAGV